MDNPLLNTLGRSHFIQRNIDYKSGNTVLTGLLTQERTGCVTNNEAQGSTASLNSRMVYRLQLTYLYAHNLACLQTMTLLVATGGSERQRLGVLHVLLEKKATSPGALDNAQKNGRCWRYAASPDSLASKILLTFLDAPISFFFSFCKDGSPRSGNLIQS